jgi:hypothetical protein
MYGIISIYKAGGPATADIGGECRYEPGLNVFTAVVPQSYN